MGSEEHIESEVMATKPFDGRDELNLAEFPLCALSHRLRPEQKTFQFQDQIRDDCRGEIITRQLTISGSDAYGLPRALDEEVLLGLIQLTKLRGFAERKVPFSRYQLIQLLGWRNETKSYERVEVSLNRWTGVTLYYRNAWWNRRKKCWMNEKFHVLDNVWLCHRPELSVLAADTEGATPASAFVWNEVLFDSFRAGNLKAIDFDFFKELRSAIAKRLYRFLDKRFFQKTRWDFDLKELAWEHVGLARGYDVASLKRKLTPGILELEQKGYLEPRSLSERFYKIRAGQWRVRFDEAEAKPGSAAPEAASPNTEALAAALAQRGVTRSKARQIAQKYPAERITIQIEVFDWMVARKDPKISRNPPGFLLAAIKEDYAPPRDFVSHQAKERRAREAGERRKQIQVLQQQRETANATREGDRQQAIQAFWASLSELEKSQMEAEAIVRAPAFQRRLIARGGTSGAAAMKIALDAYALRRLESQTDQAARNSPI